MDVGKRISDTDEVLILNLENAIMSSIHVVILVIGNDGNIFKLYRT